MKRWIHQSASPSPYPVSAGRANRQRLVPPLQAQRSVQKFINCVHSDLFTDRCFAEATAKHCRSARSRALYLFGRLNLRQPGRGELHCYKAAPARLLTFQHQPIQMTVGVVSLRHRPQPGNETEPVAPDICRGVRASWHASCKQLFRQP